MCSSGILVLGYLNLDTCLIKAAGIAFSFTTEKGIGDDSKNLDARIPSLKSTLSVIPLPIYLFSPSEKLNGSKDTENTFDIKSELEPICLFKMI